MDNGEQFLAGSACVDGRVVVLLKGDEHLVAVVVRPSYVGEAFGRIVLEESTRSRIDHENSFQSVLKRA